MPFDDMKSPCKPDKRNDKLVSLLSPSCRQASRLQSESLDRSLTFFESIGLRLHLVLCKWCRRYGEQIKFLRRAAPQSEQHAAPTAGLSPEARERIKQKLQVKE